MSLNFVILSGRLGSDPEQFGTADSVSTKFSLATNVYSKQEGKDVPLWNTVFFYGKNAENVLKLFKKGDGIVIQGELRPNKFTTKDGVEKTGYFVSGNKWDFPEKGKTTEGNSNVQTAVTPPATTTTVVKTQNTAPTQPATKKPLVATVTAAPVTHTEEDLGGFSDNDPTMEDLPF